MSREQEERGLSTADLVAATDAPPREREQENVQVGQVETRSQGSNAGARDTEQLAALFPPGVAGDFQSRWDAVQIGFVDDPQQAVRQADELVAQVMRSLAESFANERERFESQLGQHDGASTENMRVSLQRYRSFFQRLLSL